MIPGCKRDKILEEVSNLTSTRHFPPSRAPLCFRRVRKEGVNRASAYPKYTQSDEQREVVVTLRLLTLDDEWTTSHQKPAFGILTAKHSIACFRIKLAISLLTCALLLHLATRGRMRALFKMVITQAPFIDKNKNQKKAVQKNGSNFSNEKKIRQ